MLVEIKRGAGLLAGDHAYRCQAKPGEEWTADASMAFCLAESLIETHGLVSG